MNMNMTNHDQTNWNANALEHTAHTAQSTWLQVTLISVDGPRWKTTGETEDRKKRWKESSWYEENERDTKKVLHECEAFRKHSSLLILLILLIAFFYFDIFISISCRLRYAVFPKF